MQAVIKLTKALNDDEYDSMDVEDLCNANQDFDDYYAINKEIVDLALELRGRIKSQGQHAGGIIISSVPLADTIPMSYIKGKFVSQWTEGMAATQLSPFGLVKFDILGLKTMSYNVYTEELIEKARGIKICWDECDPSCDEPYAGHQMMPDGTKVPILFNDECAIKMADDVKTEAVFQFDTHVAKGVLSNGVRNFHDLVAYTALARPGPMDMIPEYVDRRDDPRQLWKKKEDPRVVEMLLDTHGIIVYQEQLTKFWTVFGGLTVPEAEKARKSVAKKKREEVLKLGPRLVEGMIKNGFSDDPKPRNDDGIYEGAKGHSAQGWWNKMVTFGRYCFNKCLSRDTVLYDPISKRQMTIENAYFNGGVKHLYAYNGEVFVDELVNIHFNGFEPVYEVEFSNGETQTVTKNHKFMNEHGQMEEVSSLFNSGHAIKYISGGVTNVQSRGRANRTANSEFVFGWQHLQGHKGEDWISCSFRRYHIEDNQEVWCPERVYNEGHEFCRSLLLRPDKSSKQSLLVGNVDSRWLYSRGSQLCELAIGGNRCGVSDSIWCRSEITKKATNLQEKEFYSNSPNSEQQALGGYLKEYEYTTGEVYERSFAGSAVYVSLDKGFCGRRRVYYCKFKGLSDASHWIKLLVFRDDSKHICARMWGEELKNYGLQEQFLCDLLDWVISAEADNEVSVSRCEQVHEEEEASGRCHITSIRFRGIEPVYSPEMKSDSHNYIINKNSTLIHANSHAYAYGVIAYRALWLKAHFAPEYWASILTYCHPDKRSKFVGVAKSEGVNFKPIRVGFLSDRLSVDDNLNVYPSLTMIKGVGEAVANSLSVDGGKCSDIDDFVARYGKKKSPIERIVKLGAFEEKHPGKAKHIWFWYQYKYATKNDEIAKIRSVFNDAYMEKNWPDSKLEDERRRQVEEYKKRYPKKNKVPIKVLNWKPKIGPKFDRPSRDEFIEFFDELWAENRKVDDKDLYYYRDWTDRNYLEFEKEYLGVYWTSPLRLYQHNPKYTFSSIKNNENHYGIIHSVVEKMTNGVTKNGNKFVNLFVNDGVETQAVRIWNDSWKQQDKEVIVEGNGLHILCDWSEKYQNFNLARNCVIKSLPRIDQEF